MHFCSYDFTFAGAKRGCSFAATKLCSNKTLQRQKLAATRNKKLAATKFAWKQVRSDNILLRQNFAATKLCSDKTLQQQNLATTKNLQRQKLASTKVCSYNTWQRQNLAVAKPCFNKTFQRQNLAATKLCSNKNFAATKLCSNKTLQQPNFAATKHCDENTLPRQQKKKLSEKNFLVFTAAKFVVNLQRQKHPVVQACTC